MMKPQRFSRSIKGFIAAFVMFFAFLGIEQSSAQYCQIWPPDPSINWYYAYCYSYYYGYISVYKITDMSNNTVVFTRNSGDDNCQYFGGDEIDLKIGRTYKLDVTGYTSYYYYGHSARFYIDWNQNGSWNDATEYLGYRSGGTYNYTYTLSWTFTIPCSTIPGKTRARTLYSGYYTGYNPDSPDACNFGYKYIYDPYNQTQVFGEAEDYVFNFLPDVDSQFPSHGDILLVNQDYDGSAGYPKPFAKMGSVQPAGTILNYKITGPRPSTSMVYEGLDPVTNNPNISMTGYQTYVMQNARGPYAGANGTFRGTQGGEYKVGITVSGSGCPGASYASFTVSWDNDLSANEVTAPRSNAAPSFYKYPQGTPIPITGVFQNVGLNDVTEFNAYASIINAAGDTLQRFQRHWDTGNGDPTLAPTKPRYSLEISG